MIRPLPPSHSPAVPPALPRLTQAQAPLTHHVEVVNERGETEQVQIPAERPLTIYVDKRELVTLMTLGAQPELLVLGYLRNQRLVESVFDIESITVDWEVHAAAVRTRHGIARIEERTASKVVTTGCGQGSVFGGLMDEVDRIALPDAQLTQAQLYGIVNAIRLKESTYKSAGSVHGCALFQGEELLTFVEDVGRHNAIDTTRGLDVDEPGSCRSLMEWRRTTLLPRPCPAPTKFSTPRAASPARWSSSPPRWAYPSLCLAQRHDADGPCGGTAAGPVRHRAGDESPVCVLQRCAPAGVAAGAGGGAFSDGGRCE